MTNNLHNKPPALNERDETNNISESLENNVDKDALEANSYLANMFNKLLSMPDMFQKSSIEARRLVRDLSTTKNNEHFTDNMGMNTYLKSLSNCNQSLEAIVNSV